MKTLRLKSTLASALLATAASIGGGMLIGGVVFSTAAQAATATAAKLGDLSEFKTLAANVLSLTEKGDMPSAVKRIKDLEVAWDSAEAGLKPRSASTWHVVDKAMDHTLSTVRDSHPDAKASAQALKELMAAFDAAK